MKNKLKKNTNKTLFEVRAKNGGLIRTSRKYWRLITRVKHPLVAGKEEEVIKTLKDPILIKESIADKKVHLYYTKMNSSKYFCVVVKNEGRRGFIITAYITNRIKKGKLIWQKNKF